MYCMSCGTGLPDQARFCFSCGNKIEAPQGTHTSTTATERTSPTSAVIAVLRRMVELLVSMAQAERYQAWRVELQQAINEGEKIIAGYGKETVIPDSLRPTTRRFIKNIMMAYVEQFGSSSDGDVGTVTAHLDKLTRTSTDLADMVYRLGARQNPRPPREYSDNTWRQLEGENRSIYLEKAAEYYEAASTAETAEQRELGLKCVKGIETFLTFGRDRDKIVAEFEEEFRQTLQPEDKFALLQRRVKKVLGNNMVAALGAGVVMSVEESEDASEFVVDTFDRIAGPTGMRDFLYELCSRWQNFALSAPTVGSLIRAYELRV